MIKRLHYWPNEHIFDNDSSKVWYSKFLTSLRFPKYDLNASPNSSGVLSLRFLFGNVTWIRNRGSVFGNVVDEFHANWISSLSRFFLLDSGSLEWRYCDTSDSLLKGHSTIVCCSSVVMVQFFVLFLAVLDRVQTFLWIEYVVTFFPLLLTILSL